MAELSKKYRRWRSKPWQTILLFGILLCFIHAFGSFTFDFFAGAATAGFGVWGEVGGVGMFYIYVLSYFLVLVVMLPILIIKRFGVGLAVYLPYAIIGLFVEYYMEWVVNQVLVSPWAVVGWCVFGLATGLSADMSYRFLPLRMSERLRSIITGLVSGALTFLPTLVALTYFYVEQQSGPGPFFGLAYYGVPFLLISSGFGGYTAWAIAQETKWQIESTTLNDTNSRKIEYSFVSWVEIANG